MLNSLINLVPILIEFAETTLQALAIAYYNLLNPLCWSLHQFVCFA